jgi:hypothetical protein
MQTPKSSTGLSLNIDDYVTSFSLLESYNNSVGLKRPRKHTYLLQVLREEMEVLKVEPVKISPLNIEELPLIVIKNLKIPKQIKTFYLLPKKEARLIQEKWLAVKQLPPAEFDCETVYSFVRNTAKIKLSVSSCKTIAGFLCMLGETEYTSTITTPWGPEFDSPAFKPKAYINIGFCFYPSSGEICIVGRQGDINKPLIRLHRDIFQEYRGFKFF